MNTITQPVDLASYYPDDPHQALLDRIASLEVDLYTYRDLFQQALHALHDVTEDRNRLRRENNEKRDELRELRAQVVTSYNLVRRAA